MTELGTALGTLPHPDPAAALAARPVALRIGADEWSHLDAVYRTGGYAGEWATAFANGRALLEAADGLRHRTPLTIEWTGGRRPPGDEVAPIDLRIDHVYLVSCKYESDILANASPARVFEGLLATQGTWDRSDWYDTVAPDQLLHLYRTCLTATGLDRFPGTPSACSRDQLDTLRHALAGRTYPDAASRSAYAELCRSVSEESARRWSDQVASSGIGAEGMLWRLLRIGSAPYFVLGNDRRTGLPARYRIASPWDWRSSYELDTFTVAPARAGQPRVDWSASYRSRERDVTGQVAGHVEIRWSHGRFAGPPEAKVYLDTPMSQLPGYHPLTPDEPDQPTLWAVR